MNRAALTSAILLTALVTPSAPVAAAGPPISGLDFDWSTFQQQATGSDNWPLTWCEDDYQYTSWGDGGGFGGTNTDGRVSLGFARVTGPYEATQTLNLWGGKNPVVPAAFEGKVNSMVCLDGDLYGWHSPGSNLAAFNYKQLIVSEDKGITWQQNAFPQSRVDGCDGCPGLPYLIDYGQNYGANQDGYVYTYWIEIQNPNDWDVQVPGVLWLTRAPAANQAFTNTANWQWLTGFDASQNPQWGVQANRAPVLQDADGLMRGSAIYVPGLDRFLMVTNHTARNQGNIAIWQAPEPWGPWSSIFKESDWPDNDPGSPPPAQFSFGSFSPKWFSADGRTGVFVFFGPDRWNSVKVTALPEPGGSATWLCGILALAALSRSERARRANRRRKTARPVD